MKNLDVIGLSPLANYLFTGLKEKNYSYVQVFDNFLMKICLDFNIEIEIFLNLEREILNARRSNTSVRHTQLFVGAKEGFLTQVCKNFEHGDLNTAVDFYKCMLIHLTGTYKINNTAYHLFDNIKYDKNFNDFVLLTTSPITNAVTSILGQDTEDAYTMECLLTDLSYDSPKAVSDFVCTETNLLKKLHDSNNSFELSHNILNGFIKPICSSYQKGDKVKASFLYKLMIDTLPNCLKSNDRKNRLK